MMSAQYLLRFDDICPAMNWSVWRAVESILRDRAIRPLLAVVPDNRDPKLNVAAPDPSFWDKVRDWQSLGWSIGMHGYRHLYATTSAGLLGRNRYSEFAALPEAAQREKIECALAIFERERVSPCAWIAPAHSFDATTVRLLAASRIDCISDGYSLWPYVCDRGLLWVPQQLGRFYRMPFGIWTVCLHINSWTQDDVDRFRDSVARFGPRIIALDELRQTYRERRRNWSDDMFFKFYQAARAYRE